MMMSMACNSVYELMDKVKKLTTVLRQLKWLQTFDFKGSIQLSQALFYYSFNVGEQNQQVSDRRK